MVNTIAKGMSYLNLAWLKGETISYKRNGARREQTIVVSSVVAPNRLEKRDQRVVAKIWYGIANEYLLVRIGDEWQRC